MRKVILFTILAVVTGQQNDSAANQLICFKERTPGPIGIMTTSSGAPIECKNAKVSLNSNLILNEYFMDTLGHTIREIIPERLLHAKAGGAFGHFETTHDISHICKAKLFRGIGKKTPVAARFSPGAAQRGGTDTSRDVRGFAVRFYTEEGNFDIVGFNTPMFVFKDPILFSSFISTQKRNPATNLNDPNMLWDFLTLHPEGLHIFLLLFGDGGIPDGYRHMPGFGIHTYEVTNEKGEPSYVRFHFSPDAGIKNLTSEEAGKIADPDYAVRDLYNAIANGEFPSWTLSVQILSQEDLKNAGFDVFDVTKVLPLDRYPLHPVGRFVLDINPTNYFSEIEQLAFSPINLVPGILGAPDKIFEARRLAYRNAQYYRLGTNYNKIPINCPIRSLTYNRDGQPPVSNNGDDSPTYFPNSFHGPVPYVDDHESTISEILQDEANNFGQATELYSNMSKEEQGRVVETIVGALGSVAGFLQERAVKLFEIIHPDLGGRIAAGLAGRGIN